MTLEYEEIKEDPLKVKSMEIFAENLKLSSEVLSSLEKEENRLMTMGYDYLNIIQDDKFLKLDAEDQLYLLQIKELAHCYQVAILFLLKRYNELS